MPTELEQCPERAQLINYLLGRLPSEDSSFCEAHLAQCDPCEQTVRSLDVSDTLSELAQNGLGKTEKLAEEESTVLKQLVGDIAKWSQPPAANKTATFEAASDSDLVDRAAEVQHFFENGIEAEDIGRVGKYRIVELLGAGSSGVVYRAIDTQLGRNVAVKFLRPSLGVVARQRFLTEAQAAAVINDPNVVQIFEVGMEDKLAFIAMQCLPGQTLEQLLNERGSLGNDETRKIGKQITAGLAAAHQAGIVHRDIKPANIWICSKTENATILDFGLARILDEDPQLTCTGLIAGTPCFMSPEQTRGRDIDRRSDFFSLGCLLYQCLTGVLPFKSENVLATLQSVQMLTPEAPIQLDPGVDSGLSSLVMTLLEKSPHNRPSQAEDISAAFDLPVSDWKFTPAQIRPTDNSKPSPINLSSKNKAVASQPTRWWPGIVAAVAIGLVSLGGFFLPQIIQIATNQGQIVIESNDPDVQVEVLQGGERIDIIDLKTKQKLSVVSGEYQIRPMGDQNEISIDKEKLTIRRGENEIVRVTRNESEAETLVAVNPSTARKGETYLLDAGDVLGVFIDGVLGKSDEAPPVHIPAVSRRPPAIGFPVVVREDGTISLPRIEELSVRGMSIKEVEKAVKKAYRTGKDPILNDQARIIVTLMAEKPATERIGKAYLLDTGDILGVFVDGVLGKFDEAPPVHVAPAGSGLPPSIGFPVAVREDGTISLPLIEELSVRGMSVKDVEKAVKTAYQAGKDPILNHRARIMVTLSRKRGYQPPVAANQLGRLAMAGAQLEAAEAEYGQHHPFVTQLRKKLMLLISEDDPASNKAGLSDQTTSAVEGEMAEEVEWTTSYDPLVAEQPTFDGKTYAEHYKMATYERNLDLVWPAIQGIIELYSEENKTKTIEACIDIFRRTNRRHTEAALSAILRTGAIVDADTLSEMLFSEVKSGTRSSRSCMTTLLTYTDESKRKQILELRTEELVKAIVESSNSGKMRAYQGAQMLRHIQTDTKLDLSSVEGIETTLLAAISSSEIVHDPNARTIEFAMNILNNSPEVIEAAFDATVKNQDLTLTKTVFKKLAKLSPDQLEVCVPLLQSHPYYSEFKKRTGSVESRYAGVVLKLIPAFGEHAKLFKDDFKEFDRNTTRSDSVYDKARAAVFGEPIND